MREEFSFGHTFDPAISDAYKTNPGTVLVFMPERYYTKFEPKWHIMKLVSDEIPYPQNSHEFFNRLDHFLDIKFILLDELLTVYNDLFFPTD